VRVLTARALTLAGVGAFAGLVAVEHVLRPDLAPGRHFISEYAIGATRPLQLVAFAAWAASYAGCAALAVQTPSGGRPVAQALTAGGLVAASAGAAGALAFTTQTVGGELPAGVARTPAGRLHDAGTLLVLAGAVTVGVASTRLVRSARYRTAVAALAAALLAVVPVMRAAGLDLPGVGQRAFIAIACAWQCAFAVSVARRPR
jgi:hypothetical protein